MAIEKPFAVLPLALSSIAAGNAKANRPASHLAQPHPGMRWESDGSGNLWVRGRFDGVRAVNFASMMAANAQPGTTIRVRLGTTQAQVDGAAPYDSTALPFIAPARTRDDNLYHSHLEIPSVQNASWWRVDIAGHTADFSAAALVFGERRTPDRFYNRDREIGFEDLGSLEIVRNGVIADTPGVVMRTLLFRLQWVEDEEFWSRWAPLGLRNTDGSKRLIYWCFDPNLAARRQDKTFLGYMGRDIFMRGNDFPLANQMDFQFRGLDFGSVPALTAFDSLRALVNAGGGSSSIHRLSQATLPGGVLTSADLSSLGNNFTQATGAQQPIISASGAAFDGSNDNIVGTVSASRSYTVVMSVTKGDASTTATITGIPSNTALIRYIQGSAIGFGSATVSANGAAVANTGALYTALHTTGEVAVSVSGIAVGADTSIIIGRNTGSLLGSVRRLVVLDHTALGGNLAAAVALAQTWVMQSE